MTTDVFPSRGFWENLDVDVHTVIGYADGPKRRKGLRGWTDEELALALELTEERSGLPDLSREGVRRWFKRRAPRTLLFLTLLSAFSVPISPRVFLEVANSLGVEHPPPRKRSLALMLFAKGQENLQLVQTRALVGSVQTTLSFLAVRPVTKSRLLSKAFQASLVAGLSSALEEPAQNIRLDLPRTSAKDDDVVYGVVYRGPRTRRKDWRGPHWDYPPLRAVMRISPKARFLQLYSRKKDRVEPLTQMLGQLIFGDPNGYRPMGDADLPTTADAQPLEESGATITGEQLCRLESENVPIEGNPSIILTGIDLSASVSQVEGLGIPVRAGETSRQVRVFYSYAGVGSETLVSWDRKSGATSYKPIPPPAVCRLVLDRVRRRLFGDGTGLA